MKNFLNKIKIILSHPTHPGNIGASARAMKNMDLSNLFLVNPKEYPSDLATAYSKGGRDVLQNAIITSTLKEAISDCSLIFGTSSRENSISWPTINLEEAISKINLELTNSKSKVAVLFGRESSGLLKDEIHKCNYQVIIPTSSEYMSLNLSQAVQIVCYELFLAFGDKHTPNLLSKVKPDNKHNDIEFATSRGMEKLYQELEKLCKDVNYLDKNNPKNLMVHLRRIFTKAKLDKSELNIMLGLIKSIHSRESGRNKV